MRFWRRGPDYTGVKRHQSNLYLWLLRRKDGVQIFAFGEGRTQGTAFRELQRELAVRGYDEADYGLQAYRDADSEVTRGGGGAFVLKVEPRRGFEVSELLPRSKPPAQGKPK